MLDTLAFTRYGYFFEEREKHEPDLKVRETVRGVIQDSEE
jgi:hypothetical protein